MSKKKNVFKRKGRKEAFKYIKKQLENSIVLDSAQILYDYNQFEAREFIRCLFGDKDGNKLIDIIDDMPKDDEDDIDDNINSSRTYPYKLASYSKSLSVLSTAIENDDIKSIKFTANLSTPYYEVDHEFAISEDELKAVATLSDLTEILIIKLISAMKHMMTMCKSMSSKINLPDYIREDYDELFTKQPEYRSYCRIIYCGISECLGSMLAGSNTSDITADYGVMCYMSSIGSKNAIFNITGISMTYYDENDSAVQKSMLLRKDSQILSKDIIEVICNADYETAFCPKTWNADDAPIQGTVIAFTASNDCESSNGNTIHVGLLTDATCKEDKPSAIIVPSCATKIYTTQTELIKMMLSEFKKDSIIIDTWTMFYPVKNDDDDIFYKYYGMSLDEAGMVADIVSDIEPGKFFTSGEYPETQKKINTLLKMLQQACPDVDIKAHDITLVDDYVVYDDIHALNCIDVALTDTAEE